MWPEPKIASSTAAAANIGSFKEQFQKAVAIEAKQNEAKAILQKAMPTMEALLQLRLLDRTPLEVMRDLSYQTSAIAGQDDEDDGFYKSRAVAPKFVDVVKTIRRGDTLLLKSIDNQMQEFIFEDSSNKEHAISFTNKEALMLQTNIYEDVLNLINTGVL